MSCRIYLVRHGETTWNALLKFQGHADVALTERGREQARALSKRLEKHKLTAFYASDLDRAVETAKILANPHGLQVSTVPALREINFGLWEGLTINEIKEKHGEVLQQWWAGPLKTRVPGGETLAEVVERTKKAVKEIVERHAGEHVVVVCHGGTIRCLVGWVLGMDLNQYWRLRQDNVSLNIIDFPAWEKGILMLFNDCTHLGSD